MSDERHYHPKTLAVRAGSEASAHREHSEALFLTSSFTFDSAAQGAAIFAREEKGYLYARVANPTVAMFERRYAALEGAEAAMGVASGMSAIFTTCMALLSAGDRVVCAREVFGSTYVLFEQLLPRWGIVVDFVALSDLDGWREALSRPATMVLVETPSNPTLEVVDLAALAEIVHAAGALLVVDNAFCTPAVQRPIAHGADLTVTSATKFVDGQGRILGGVIAGREEMIRGPILTLARSTGPTMSAFNAWVLLKSLETLPVRMAAHCDHAEAVAAALAARGDLVTVTYPGLPTYRHRDVVARQMERGGALITFDVGSRERAMTLVDRLQLFSRTANLGDARSIVTHPATTTHSRMTPEARAAAGVSEGLVRLAIGLEDPRDLVMDLHRALDG
ncbi:MAG: O-succinylhomoserine sulfhydrylase [Deltaproteobacteria bacterium]|nr:MAG: O-succinylhomoserine sulfhydrylase [Deltaproteobacteria bacterium]